MKYLRIKTGDIPGVEVKEDGAYAEVAGQSFAVIGILPDKEYGFIPVLDIPQISDEQLRELAREHPVKSWAG